MIWDQMKGGLGAVVVVCIYKYLGAWGMCESV